MAMNNQSTLNVSKDQLICIQLRIFSLNYGGLNKNNGGGIYEVEPWCCFFELFMIAQFTVRSCLSNLLISQ